MDKSHTILVADRNANVREFLRRELVAEGYDIRLAKCGREVLKWAYRMQHIGLIILDLDLPGIDEQLLFRKLQDRIPVLPIIIHSFQSDDTRRFVNYKQAVFVEKRGNSIEKLKKAINELLSIRATAQPSGTE